MFFIILKFSTTHLSPPEPEGLIPLRPTGPNPASWGHMISLLHLPQGSLHGPLNRPFTWFLLVCGNPGSIAWELGEFSKSLNPSGPQFPHFKKEVQLKSDTCQCKAGKCLHVLAMVLVRTIWGLQQEVTFLLQGQGWQPNLEPEDEKMGADQRIRAANKGRI